MSMFPRRRSRPPPRRRRGPPGKAQTRVDRHAFTADDAIPPDHRDRRTCSACHCLGEPGDAHHYGPDDTTEQYPDQDEQAREFDRRRTGEAGDDD